jgi:hypothetical protein
MPENRTNAGGVSLHILLGNQEQAVATKSLIDSSENANERGMAVRMRVPLAIREALAVIY